MRIVCISDTHSKHNEIEVPDGDVLVHAGDITSRGELSTVNDFNNWIGKLPHKHKVVIAGNHDFCFEDELKDNAVEILNNCIYLQDSSCEIDGVKFYGTPWQPWFYDWAFNVKSEEEREGIWAKIPDDTDVLIVHGPPYMHGDEVMSDYDNVGCRKLLARIKELNIKLVVTGHIHESYGEYNIGDTKVVNASTCDFAYDPINPPIVIDY